MNGWSSEQWAVRARFAELAAAHVAPNAEALFERGEFDHDAWRKLAAEDLFCLGVPEFYGGLGGTWADSAAAVEGLASAADDLGFPLSVIAHLGMIRGLVELGSESQKRRYLPPLLSGAVGATAVTESSGGTDVARVRTRGMVVPGGWELVGSKAHVTNAPVADFALVVCRLEGLPVKRDITVAIIERGDPGVEWGQPERLLGLRTSPTGPIVLGRAFIADGRVLGAPGDGLNVIYNVITFDRLLYGLVAAARIDALVAQTVRYARERHASGVPIAEHEYVQGRIVEMYLGAQSARLLAHAALDQVLRGQTAARAMCSAAKLVGSEALCQATQHAMAIFGHQGYEHGSLTRAAADALGTRIAGGTAEAQRKAIFAHLLRASTSEREAA